MSAQPRNRIGIISVLLLIVFFFCARSCVFFQENRAADARSRATERRALQETCESFDRLNGHVPGVTREQMEATRRKAAEAANTHHAH